LSPPDSLPALGSSIQYSPGPCLVRVAELGLLRFARPLIALRSKRVHPRRLPPFEATKNRSHVLGRPRLTAPRVRALCYAQSIRSQVWPGAQQTVLRCLSSLSYGLRWSELSTWLRMGLNSQIVVVGLLTGLICDHLILRERTSR
jgi:hypothetical protein